MAEEKKYFDHNEHTRRLDEAANYLRGIGLDELAGAVERARSLHFDMTSRLAEGRRVRDRLMKSGEKLIQQARVMDEYVTHVRGPWIGCELFPPGWPDHVDKKDDE